MLQNNSNFFLASELQWKIDWINAFPIDLTHDMLFLLNDDHPYKNDNYYDKDDKIIEWKEDDDINPMLSQIAFHSIFTHHMNDARDGHEASRYDYQQHEEAGFQMNESLGYGEISIKVIISYIFYIVKLHGMENGDNSIEVKLNKVLDLGSGSGKMLFAAALAYPFREAVGIEILPSLHNLALSNLKQWDSNSVFDNSIMTSKRCAFTKFLFMNGDITHLTQDEEDAKHIDVVLCHATVFDIQLMEVVTRFCLKCQVGTYFIMISKSLDRMNFEVIKLYLERMSWGFADVYLQRRI